MSQNMSRSIKSVFPVLKRFSSSRREPQNDCLLRNKTTKFVKINRKNTTVARTEEDKNGLQTRTEQEKKPR